MSRFRAVGLLVAAALAVAAAGCGGGGNEGSGTTELKVAETAGMPSSFLSYAVDRGYFRDQGLSVEVQTGQGGAAAIPALVGGDVQVAGSNVVSVLLAASKGVPIKLVAPGTFADRTPERDFSAIVVKPGGDVRSLRDLEGKTVAVNTLDNIAEVTLLKVLTDAGADVEKVKLTEVDFPDMQATLDRGQVDAVYAIEPFATRMEAAGDRVIGRPYVGTRPGLQVGAYVMTEQFLGSNQATADKFRAAVGRTATAIKDDPAAFRDFLVAQKAVPEAAAQDVRLPVWGDEVDRASLDQIAALMQRYAVAPKRPSVAAVLTSGG